MLSGHILKMRLNYLRSKWRNCASYPALSVKKIHSLFLILHHCSTNYLSIIRSYATTGKLSKVRGRTTRWIGNSSKPKKNSYSEASKNLPNRKQTLFKKTILRIRKLNHRCHRLCFRVTAGMHCESVQKHLK